MLGRKNIRKLSSELVLTEGADHATLRGSSLRRLVFLSLYESLYERTSQRVASCKRDIRKATRLFLAPRTAPALPPASSLTFPHSPLTAYMLGSR